MNAKELASKIKNKVQEHSTVIATTSAVVITAGVTLIIRKMIVEDAFPEGETTYLHFGEKTMNFWKEDPIMNPYWVMDGHKFVAEYCPDLEI